MAERLVSCNVLDVTINLPESELDAETVLVPSSLLLSTARLAGKVPWEITAEHEKWHVGSHRHSNAT